MMIDYFKNNKNNFGLVYSLLLFYFIRTAFVIFRLSKRNYVVIAVSFSLFIFFAAIVLSKRMIVHIIAVSAGMAAVALYQGFSSMPARNLFDRYYDVLVPIVPMVALSILNTSGKNEKRRTIAAALALLFSLSAVVMIIPLGRHHRLDEGNIYYGSRFYIYYYVASGVVAVGYIVTALWLSRQKTRKIRGNKKKKNVQSSSHLFDNIVCCILVVSGVAVLIAPYYYVIADTSHMLLNVGYIVLDSYLLSLGFFIYDNYERKQEQT